MEYGVRMAEERLTVTRVDERTAIDPHQVETFARLAKGSVGVVNLHRTLAHSPVVFARFIDFAHALRFETVLDARLRELAILRVLAHHRGDYEARHHRKMALAAGASEEACEAATAGAFDGLPAVDTAVLRFADAFARGAGVTPEIASALKEHMDDRQCVELSLTLTLYLGLAHFTHAVDVPVEAP